MSKAVANQLFVAYLGRPADTQWQSATAILTENMGNFPSTELQKVFYNAAVLDGRFSATDSSSVLVNKIFLNTFGFAASSFEQTAWGGLVTNGSLPKEGLAWTIFSSYLGATNVPAIYQLPTQSKLVAADAFTSALTGSANAAFSQLDSVYTASGRTYLDGVTSQATAANAIANVTTTINSVWSGSSGLGEISVLKALGLVTGTAISDVSSATTLGWGISSVKFQDAWNAGYTGKGVVIADIDTGIDLNNKVLNHNLSKYNWNFVSNNANVQDDNGHGSLTASELIATTSSNNNGVVGGAYDAQLMVLKAIGASGIGSDSNIALAITYAVNHGANVINLSFGGSASDQALQSALQYASSQGVVVAIAAGNSAANSPAYPASYAQSVSNVLAVGATQQSGSSLTLASFSNQSGGTTPYNFVDAPGVAIQGYNASGQVITGSGTSVSAPLVAAEAAILEQAIAAMHPEYNIAQIAAQVIADITQTATPLSLVGVASTIPMHV